MEYSIGEIIDRLTILELKRDRQLNWIDTGELAALEEEIRRHSSDAPIDPGFRRELKDINSLIWDLAATVFRNRA